VHTCQEEATTNIGGAERPIDRLRQFGDAWDVDQDYADYLNQQGGVRHYTKADFANNPVLRERAMRMAMNTKMPSEYAVGPDESIDADFLSRLSNIIVLGEPHSMRTADRVADQTPQRSRIVEIENEEQEEAFLRPAKTERKRTYKPAAPAALSDESTAAMQARLERKMGVPPGYLGSTGGGHTTKYVPLQDTRCRLFH